MVPRQISQRTCRRPCEQTGLKNWSDEGVGSENEPPWKSAPERFTEESVLPSKEIKPPFQGNQAILIDIVKPNKPVGMKISIDLETRS
jgi:hypothetical protein